MFKGVLKAVKEGAFPEGYVCELCGEETFRGWICDDCIEEMPFNSGIVCPVCGRRTTKSDLCNDCHQKIPLFDLGVSALVYEGGARRLVRGFKNGKRYLKNYFADLLEPRIKALPAADAIVYVPMTEKALRARGYNQSELLARELSARLGIPVLDILEKTKDTSQQKELTREERAENLRTCFKVTDRKACKGKCFLLVDDVLTTGATADAVSEKLKAAGAKKVIAATAASVEYREREAALPRGETQNG